MLVPPQPARWLVDGDWATGVKGKPPPPTPSVWEQVLGREQGFVWAPRDRRPRIAAQEERAGARSLQRRAVTHLSVSIGAGSAS